MVLIEAQSYSKPVIGTSIGGIPYVIKDQETGFLVPPRDSKKLAECIIKIISNPDLAKLMGNNGRRRVKNEFTWIKSVNDFNIIMKEVIK
jgi:glycosyltransferase involved in cell wall biosynthesis